MPLFPVRQPWAYYHDHRAFGHGAQPVQRVILHSTESGDYPASAHDIKGVCDYWARTPYPERLAAQFLVDKQGLIGQTTPPRIETWHTGGANYGSVGIEQIGYAHFLKPVWMMRHAQLRQVAKLIAWLHKDYGVPLVVSTDRGVSTHAMQSKIHPESLGHTDPGAGYPLYYVVQMAAYFVRRGGWNY